MVYKKIRRKHRPKENRAAYCFHTKIFTQSLPFLSPATSTLAYLFLSARTYQAMVLKLKHHHPLLLPSCWLDLKNHLINKKITTTKYNVPLCANIDEESTKSTQIIPSLVQIGPDFKKTCNIY